MQTPHHRFDRLELAGLVRASDGVVFPSFFRCYPRYGVLWNPLTVEGKVCTQLARSQVCAALLCPLIVVGMPESRAVAGIELRVTGDKEEEDRRSKWCDDLEPGINSFTTNVRNSTWTKDDELYWKYGNVVGTWPTDAELRRRARYESADRPALSNCSGVDEVVEAHENSGCSADSVQADLKQYKSRMNWHKPGDGGIYTHFDLRRSGDFYTTQPSFVKVELVVNDCNVRFWSIASTSMKPSAPVPPVSSQVSIVSGDSQAIELARNVRVISTKNLTPTGLAMCSFASGRSEEYLEQDGVFVVVEGVSAWAMVLQKLRQERKAVYTIGVIEVCPVNDAPTEVHPSLKHLFTYKFSPFELVKIAYNEQVKVSSTRAVTPVETIEELLRTIASKGSTHKEPNMQDVSRREFVLKTTKNPRRKNFPNKNKKKWESVHGTKSVGLELALLSRMIEVALPQDFGLGECEIFQNALRNNETCFPDVCPSKLLESEKNEWKAEMMNVLKTANNGAVVSDTMMSDTESFLDRLYSCPLTQAVMRFLFRIAPNFMSLAAMVRGRAMQSCVGDVSRAMFLVLSYITYLKTKPEDRESAMSRSAQVGMVSRLKAVLTSVDVRTRYINGESIGSEPEKYDLSGEDEIEVVEIKAATGAKPFGSQKNKILLTEDVLSLLGTSGVGRLSGNEGTELAKTLVKPRSTDMVEGALEYSPVAMMALVSYLTQTSNGNMGVSDLRDALVPVRLKSGERLDPSRKAGEDDGPTITVDRRGRLVGARTLQLEQIADKANKAVANDRKGCQKLLDNVLDVSGGSSVGELALKAISRSGFKKIPARLMARSSSMGESSSSQRVTRQSSGSNRRDYRHGGGVNRSEDIAGKACEQGSGVTSKLSAQAASDAACAAAGRTLAENFRMSRHPSIDTSDAITGSLKGSDNYQNLEPIPETSSTINRDHGSDSPRDQQEQNSDCEIVPASDARKKRQRSYLSKEGTDSSEDSSLPVKKKQSCGEEFPSTPRTALELLADNADRLRRTSAIPRRNVGDEEGFRNSVDLFVEVVSQLDKQFPKILPASADGEVFCDEGEVDMDVYHQNMANVIKQNSIFAEFLAPNGNDRDSKIEFVKMVDAVSRLMQSGLHPRQVERADMRFYEYDHQVRCTVKPYKDYTLIAGRPPDPSPLLDFQLHGLFQLRYSPVLSGAATVLRYLEECFLKNHIEGADHWPRHQPGWFERLYPSEDNRDSYTVSYVRVIRCLNYEYAEDAMPEDEDSPCLAGRRFDVGEFYVKDGLMCTRGVLLDDAEVQAIYDHAAECYASFLRGVNNGDLPSEKVVQIPVHRRTGIEACYPWVEKFSGHERIVYDDEERTKYGCAYFKCVQIRGNRITANLHDLVVTSRWDDRIRHPDLKNPLEVEEEAQFGSKVLPENVEICLLEAHPRIPGAWVTPCGSNWDYESEIVRAIISRAQGFREDELSELSTSAFCIRQLASKIAEEVKDMDSGPVSHGLDDAVEGQLMINFLSHGTIKSYTSFAAETRRAKDGENRSACGFDLCVPLQVSTFYTKVAARVIHNIKAEAHEWVDNSVVFIPRNQLCHGVSSVIRYDGLYYRWRFSEKTVFDPETGSTYCAPITASIARRDDILPTVLVLEEDGDKENPFQKCPPIWKHHRLNRGVYDDLPSSYPGIAHAPNPPEARYRATMNWSVTVSMLSPMLFWGVEWCP